MPIPKPPRAPKGERELRWVMHEEKQKNVTQEDMEDMEFEQRVIEAKFKLENRLLGPDNLYDGQHWNETMKPPRPDGQFDGIMMHKWTYLHEAAADDEKAEFEKIFKNEKLTFEAKAELAQPAAQHIYDWADNIKPHHIAAASGHVSMLKYLIEHGADPDEQDRTNTSYILAYEERHGRRAMHWAAMRGHKKVVKYLVEEIGVNPGIPEYYRGDKKKGERDVLLGFHYDLPESEYMEEYMKLWTYDDQDINHYLELQHDLMSYEEEQANFWDELRYYFIFVGIMFGPLLATLISFCCCWTCCRCWCRSNMKKAVQDQKKKN